MEVPSLSVSTIGCLDDHVSVVDQVKISIVWELRNYMEISLDIESELFVEFSLSWLSLPLVSVHNIPLLIDLAVFVLSLNISVFLINVSTDMKNSSSLIGYIDILVSK
jgi:hypothetical protein